MLETKIDLYIIYLFSFFLISCSNTSESFLELESCVNDKLISKLNSYNNIDNTDDIINKFSLFDTIAGFENQLIKQKLLLGKTRKDYLKLIVKLEESEDIKSNYKKVVDNNRFLDYISNDITTTNFLYDRCPNEVGLSNNIKNTYFEIFNEGYPTIDILNKLIRMKDFENNIFRKSICYLVFIHLKFDKANNEGKSSPPKF